MTLALAKRDQIAPGKGYIFGLTLSNNGSDATNDIDIAAGECASTETDPVLMVLASALTKRLDAAWAVGTNQGGLDTGSIGNNTYHIWLIRRPDTGVVDALFSLSATAPTMPTNYTQKRRIGSIVRASATIRPFKQVDDSFFWTTGVEDRNSASAFSAALLTVGVPSGIVVRPIMYIDAAASSGAINIDIAFGSAASGSITTIAARMYVAFQGAFGVIDQFYTNTSAQIYYRVAIGSGTLSFNYLITTGYIDTRGKDS